MKKRHVVFISWLMFFLGTSAMVLSLAVPHWRGNHEFSEGIFQRCAEARCDRLVFYEGGDSELDLVRLLMIIGLFYIFLSSMLGLFSMVTIDIQTCLRVLSFLHITVGLSLYTYWYADHLVQWCFILVWCGVVVYAIGFILIFYSSYLPEDSAKTYYTLDDY